MNSIQKQARIAGVFFLLNFLVPSLNWSFVLSKLAVAGNVNATVSNILNNEFLFRLGISFELFMSVGLVVLALLLYQILKAINKNLAMLALFMKLIESTLIAVTVLIPFIALQIINEASGLNGITPQQLQYPVGLIFNSHTAIVSIPMVFLGIDMILFCYLFFKSNYIPRMIAAFGILSFVLIFIHSLMFILTPEYSEMPINQIIFWTPSGLFEIVVGIWLIVKGVNTQEINVTK